MSNCDTTRYAEAWEFATFFCASALLTGTSSTAGATMTDTTVDFSRLGIKAGEGMLLWNLTQDTQGLIVAYTQHTLEASGVTWAEGDSYRAVAQSQSERSAVEHYLTITASNIHAALASVGACDCTLASWALDYLKKINILETVWMYNCNCPTVNLTPEERAAYRDDANTMLTNISSGALTVCQSSTSSQYPAIGYAEQNVNDFTARAIVARRIRRLGR